MVRSMRFLALASSAMCCAMASPALAMTGEPFTEDVGDGHISSSICSISDGMGSIGGGSTESLCTNGYGGTQEAISEGHGGFDAGTLAVSAEVWGGTKSP